MNNPPLRDDLSVAANKTAWPPAWAQWFTQVFKCLKGWNESFTNTATINFGSISAQSQATSNVTVTGVKSGDAVIIQAETATNGIDYDGTVTADDTVTVRAKNYGTVAVDPASMSFRIIVLRN